MCQVLAKGIKSELMQTALSILCQSQGVGQATCPSMNEQILEYYSASTRNKVLSFGTEFG
jgi:hypothetical protein